MPYFGRMCKRQIFNILFCWFSGSYILNNSSITCFARFLGTLQHNIQKLGNCAYYCANTFATYRQSNKPFVKTYNRATF